MLRARAACVLCLVLLTSSLWGRPGVVETTDGQRFVGELTEGGAGVAVEASGIRTVVPRDQIASIRYTGTFEEEFARRLKALDDADAAGRAALAREAFASGAYELAEVAAEQALEIAPENEQAADLLTTTRRQIRLELARRVERESALSARPRLMPQPAASGLLDAEQINLIRQEELKPTDYGVRILLPASLRREFAFERNTPVAQFLRRSTLEQALAVIEHGTPEQRAQVRIGSDPSGLLEFKRFVQPLVLNGCASSGCHGGDGAGGLALVQPANSDAATYANFLILAMHRHAPGEGRGPFAPTEVPMVVRGAADRSLLANYMLPAEIAEHDHPPVRGFRSGGLLRDRDDPRYRRLAAWMEIWLTHREPRYESLTTTRPTTPSTAEVR